ncbi:aminoacyltransferase [Macrococcus equipercicus]|uniref:Aminoacyltransferase FemA n=1 Tax=Macrococcus equipercicus TaxID=69967 RepID=A0A9Q9BRW9_9STAP|nr:aminoacyltransferase [Macrococcus equipercicus]KAA1040270.1 aminoacyltransferase [Macrococcus equipercicus]UTH12786.1 aminoacyltransferase [Macrococcus equipercicus]
MKFTTLTREQFGEFCDSQSYSHFTQMAVNYDLKTSEGTETHLVGVTEGGRIIAASLLTAVPVLKTFKYFYSNRGPVMDYSNKELTTFFFTELKRYVKQHRALMLRVDPYVPYQRWNHDGEKLETYPSASLLETLPELGYDHQGFTTGFHPVHQIRWHSILDLTGKDDKQVLKDMDSLRKRNIKKVLKNGVKVRFLEKDEIQLFRNFMKDTSGKKEFLDRDDKFYTDRMKYFGDRVLVPLAYIDFKTYIPELEAEQDRLTKDIAKAAEEIDKKPDNKKAVNKKEAAEQQLASVEEKLLEAKTLHAQHGDTLPIAASFFLINPYEVVYLAGGSSNEFRHFAGSYAIQWKMINYALDHHIDRYNFYGISGDFSDQAEDAGVIKFKKGFNADVIEYIGDFVAPINKPVYKVYSALKRIRG